MVGLHVAVIMGAGACLSSLAPVACGDQWCLEGYRCAPDTLTCLKSACGNGVVEMGEECDDGNGKNGDGCDNNCTRTACGNGVVTAGEQCDDGNTVNTDTCRNDCTVNNIPH